MIILSILIPTLPERHSLFIELYGKLWRQIYHVHTNHTSLGEIEWISDDSPSFLNGGLSIGKKRESLVKRAEGKYLCFLDDDEDIAPNYVETLVRLCQHNTDVITFRNLTKTDHYWTIVDMSLNYIVNDQANPKFITRRKPWHICPVRTEFAKLYEFDDINYSEDSNWMEKVLKHCTTESHTDAVLHQYNHSKINSEADKITNHVLTKS